MKPTSPSLPLFAVAAAGGCVTLSAYGMPADKHADHPSVQRSQRTNKLAPDQADTAHPNDCRNRLLLRTWTWGNPDSAVPDTNTPPTPASPAPPLDQGPFQQLKVDYIDNDKSGFTYREVYC